MAASTGRPHRRIQVVAVGALLAVVAALAPAAALVAVAVAEPASPVIVGPVGGTTSSNPTFEWQPVPGAVSYLVWIDTPQSTGNPPFPTVNTMLTDVLFQQSTHVDWAVAAVDSDGAQGPRSEASFDVGPLVPSLLAPGDGATFTFPGESPYLSWQPAFDGGAALYYIDGRTGEPSIPDLAGLQVYRAELGGVPGSFRWTAGQVLAPPPGTAPVRTFSVTWPDSVPALVSPADGADAGTTAPVLSWTRVDGASGYDVQLDDAADFSSPTLIDNVRALLTPASGLAAGTWHWRVRAREPHDGHGDWSAARTLVVPEIATPVLQGPADAADLTEYPLLRWQPVAGADGYQIQLTPSQDDPNISIRTVDATVFAAEPPGWQASAPIPFGPGPQTLTWRVRATFPSGGYAHDGASPWTAWRTFTVDPPNGGPHGSPSLAPLVAPDSCLDPATCAAQPWAPVLDWDAVDGAAFYRVFFQDGGDGTGPSTSSYDTAGSTFFHPFMTGFETVVGWDVVACPSTATCPTSIDTLRRRYRIATPAPTIIGPADGAHSIDPAVVVSWSPATVDPSAPSSPITSYELGLQRLVNGDWTAWQGAFVPGTQTAYAIPNVHGDDWKWRVRAHPAVGPASAWSAWRGFDHPPVPPTITEPADGATTDSTPRLRWDSAPSMNLGYHVDLVRGTPASDTDWNGLPRWGFNVTGRSLDVQPNLAPGDYTWRVSRGNAASISHFTVEPAAPPVLLAPGVGASVPDDRGVFTWQPVAGAATYQVDLATDPDFAPEHRIDSGPAWGTTYATRLRLPAGAVYWRVTAYAPGYNAIGASSSDVTIGVSEPRLALAVATIVDTTAPTATAPAHALQAGGLTAGKAPVRLTWTGSDVGTGIAHYVLSEQRDGGTWSTGVVVPGTSVTRSYSPGHTYRVRVRAVDNAANLGTWATGSTFRLTGVSQASGSVAYRGTWASHTSSTWWGGSVRSSSTARSTAKLRFTGRSIAWVSLTASTRGKAQVFVNGVLKATVDLKSTTTQPQQIVWVGRWSTSATRTVEIRVLGTSGRPRVDVDGFIVGS